MPRILRFVWQLLLQLTKPFWCSILGIWRYGQFQRWQWKDAKLQTQTKVKVKK